MMVRFSKIVVLALTMIFGAAALLVARKGAEFRMNEKVLFSVEVTSEYGQERIESWRSDEAEFFIFLPSYADLAKTKLYQNRPGEVTIDGEPIINGMTCENFQWNAPYELTCRIAGEFPETRITFLKSDNIPTMYIDTRSGNMDYIHKKKGNEETGKVRLYTDDGKIDYAGNLDKISGRGNVTWSVSAKKPYSIVLQNAGNLLEMGAAQNWILLANAIDDTNLRNKIVLDFAKTMEMSYSPQCEWINLYLNGEYAGLYLLCERNEVHPERVNLAPNGSFLVSEELEERLKMDDHPYLVTEHNIPLRIRYASAPTDEIRNVFQSAENAILAENGIDPVTGKSWQELIDAESWAKKYLLEEVFANVDGGRVSQFYYWNGDKIYAGPVWDYDLTMGINLSWDTFTYVPEMFYANRPGDDGAAWFWVLYGKQEFYDRVTELYQKEFQPLLVDFLETEVPQYAAEIAASAGMNAVRWAAGDFGMAVEDLQEYLSRRMEFLDAVWTRNEEYYMVRIYLEKEPPLCYAVCPGAHMAELLETVNMGGTVSWYLAETGEPFDPEQPIYKDTDVFFRIETLEPEFAENS